MRYELNEALKFAHASDELIEELKKHLPYKECDKNLIEYNGCHFKFNDEHYDLVEVGEDPIEDEGKYQNGGTYYQLVKYDNNIDPWPSDESILEKYDVQVYLTYYISGSYFSDWNYNYDLPIIQRITIVDVPEVVIPAHQEVKTENIE